MKRSLSHVSGTALGLAVTLAFVVWSTAAAWAQGPTKAGQAAGQPTTERPRPRYLDAIDRELEALSIPHACEAVTDTRAQCSFRQRGRASGRELDVTLVYSDETDTIYLYVARLLTAPADATTTPAVLRRLMELNWQLLVGKLEWNEADGEVRLSMVMNTDSNFDRRAFRSIVRQLVPLADRYLDELGRLAAEP